MLLVCDINCFEAFIFHLCWCLAKFCSLYTSIKYKSAAYAEVLTFLSTFLSDDNLLCESLVPSYFGFLPFPPVLC